jgi:hypothetical protein
MHSTTVNRSIRNAISGLVRNDCVFFPGDDSLWEKKTKNSASQAAIGRHLTASVVVPIDGQFSPVLRLVWT